MGIVVDSSVLIAWERKQLDLETQMADHVEEDFAISAMTASELLHGVHRAATPAQRSQREDLCRGIVTANPCLLLWSRHRSRPCSFIIGARGKENPCGAARPHHCGHGHGEWLRRSCT